MDASGEATCTQTYSGEGSHSIVATFSGDTVDQSSVSVALTQDVSGTVTSTTTAVSSSPSDSVAVGQQVTYTATVSPTPNGGTVSFSDGGTPLLNCQDGRPERRDSHVRGDLPRRRLTFNRRDLQRRRQLWRIDLDCSQSRASATR